MSDNYDPAKDGHDSYYAAIEAKRLRGDTHCWSDAQALAIRKAAGLGCEKCNFTGVFGGKLGGKWTHYPQIKCECQAK